MINKINCAVWEKPGRYVIDQFRSFEERILGSLSPRGVAVASVVAYCAFLVFINAPMMTLIAAMPLIERQAAVFTFKYCLLAVGVLSAILCDKIPAVKSFLKKHSSNESIAIRVCIAFYAALLAMPLFVALKSAYPVLFLLFFAGSYYLAWKSYFLFKQVLLQDNHSAFLINKVKTSIPNMQKKSNDSDLAPIQSKGTSLSLEWMHHDVKQHVFKFFNDKDFAALCQTSKKVKGIIEKPQNLPFAKPFLKKRLLNQWIIRNENRINNDAAMVMVLDAIKAKRNFYLPFLIDLIWNTQFYVQPNINWQRLVMKNFIHHSPDEMLDWLDHFSEKDLVNIANHVTINPQYLVDIQDVNYYKKVHTSVKDEILLELYRVFALRDKRKCFSIFNKLSTLESKLIAISIKKKLEWVHGHSEGVVGLMEQECRKDPAFVHLNSPKVVENHKILEGAKAYLELFQNDKIKLNERAKSFDQLDPSYILFIRYQLHHMSDNALESVDHLNPILKNKMFKKMAQFQAETNIFQALETCKMIPHFSEHDLLKLTAGIEYSLQKEKMVSAITDELEKKISDDENNFSIFDGLYL